MDEVDFSHKNLLYGTFLVTTVDLGLLHWVGTTPILDCCIRVYQSYSVFQLKPVE